MTELQIKNRLQFGLRHMLFLFGMVALCCGFAAWARNAINRGYSTETAALFLIANALVIASPIIGAWMGIRIGRYFDLPSHYIGPAGLVLGFLASILFFRLAQYLAFEFLISLGADVPTQI